MTGPIQSCYARFIPSTGMTAQSVPMDKCLLDRITSELLALDGIAAVCYDLTHKPPATIEWE
jgi:GMP synthase PP-ATPase subunit